MLSESLLSIFPANKTANFLTLVFLFTLTHSIKPHLNFNWLGKQSFSHYTDVCVGPVVRIILAKN